MRARASPDPLDAFRDTTPCGRGVRRESETLLPGRFRCAGYLRRLLTIVAGSCPEGRIPFRDVRGSLRGSCASRSRRKGSSSGREGLAGFGPDWRLLALSLRAFDRNRLRTERPIRGCASARWLRL